MKLFLFVSEFVLCITLIYTAKMPDFIPTCKGIVDQPNLSDCAIKNGQLAIAGIVKGSRSYGIPSMSPLHIPRIDIQAGNNLNIVLTDNAVSGLGDTIVNAVDINITNQHILFNVTIPQAKILGHYNMNGHVLILPIRGEGHCNITFEGGNYIYNMDYTLNLKHDKEYLVITDHNITFTTKRAYYYFENLFNGDPQLGPQMNRFLNENWAEVTKDLGVTVAETISSIITSLAMTLFTKVPLEEVLPAA